MLLKTGFVAVLLAGVVRFAYAEDGAASLAFSAAQAQASGNLDLAATELDAALKRFPRSPDLDVVYWQSCRLKLVRNDAADALVFCAAAILRNPKNSNFYADRAEAYFRSGDADNAWRDVLAAKAAGNRRASIKALEARLSREADGADSVRKTAMPAVVPPSKPNAAPVAALRCSRPVNWAVRELCRNAKLKAMDVRMQLRYAAALTVAADVSTLQASQRDWIARRDACQNRDCLIMAYTERTAFLTLWSAE